MNQTLGELSNIWNRFQTSLFPGLQEGLGQLTDKQQQLIRVLEVSQIETHIPYVGQVPGCPLEDRSAIARAFVAKAVYNLPTTERLLDRLKSDISLRRDEGRPANRLHCRHQTQQQRIQDQLERL